jgi:hypothetical protein
MALIDDISRLPGDDLRQALKPGARLRVAASRLSMSAFEAPRAVRVHPASMRPPGRSP